MSTAQQTLEERLKQRALELGFELAGIAAAIRPDGLDHFQDWLHAGHAGEMHYLPRRQAAYEHPSGVLPSVRSVIMVAMNYAPPDTVQDAVQSTAAATGRIARYAVGPTDYHDVLRDRLKQLAGLLHTERPGCRTRVAVDTAPLLERDFARRAGLGWFGKNTMLIHRQQGSWFFLAALLTDVELTPDEPHHTSHCGTCTRCLTACPTNAFVQPYVLDARRCISYLTIELRDQPIPLDLRDDMGNWVFGCDVCQEVCPWNRKAPATAAPEFFPRASSPGDSAISPTVPALAALLSLDQSAFDANYSATPLSRPGRSGVLRNAAIAAGNSGDAGLVPALEDAAQDADPLIAEAAHWALRKLSEVKENSGNTDLR